MNAYMSDGAPVVPVGPRELMNISDTNASSTIGSLDLLNSSMAGTRLLAPGQFKHLDYP